MKKDEAKKFAVGAVLAGAAGYVAGILTAPKSGRETRQDVKNAAIKAKTEAEKSLKKLHSDLDVQIQRARDSAKNIQATAKDGLDKALGRAVTAKEKAREMLTALHEGGAEDKDLQKAIQEVGEALTHLRAYLDKNAK